MKRMDQTQKEIRKQRDGMRWRIISLFFFLQVHCGLFEVIYENMSIVLLCSHADCQPYFPPG